MSTTPGKFGQLSASHSFNVLPFLDGIIQSILCSVDKSEEQEFYNDTTRMAVFEMLEQSGDALPILIARHLKLCIKAVGEYGPDGFADASIELIDDFVKEYPQLNYDFLTNNLP